jgi:hypothetical protein
MCKRLNTDPKFIPGARAPPFQTRVRRFNAFVDEIVEVAQGISRSHEGSSMVLMTFGFERESDRHESAAAEAISRRTTFWPSSKKAAQDLLRYRAALRTALISREGAEPVSARKTHWCRFSWLFARAGTSDIPW